MEKMFALDNEGKSSQIIDDSLRLHFHLLVFSCYLDYDYYKTYQ